MLRTDVPIAFVAPDGEPSELEIRINFGVFAGREATPAELDELGRAVMAEVEHVTLVSEHRHELERDSETSLHQVRMDIPRGRAARRHSRGRVDARPHPQAGRALDAELLSTRATPK